MLSEGDLWQAHGRCTYMCIHMYPQTHNREKEYRTPTKWQLEGTSFMSCPKRPGNWSWSRHPWEFVWATLLCCVCPSHFKNPPPKYSASHSLNQSFVQCAYLMLINKPLFWSPLCSPAPVTAGSYPGHFQPSLQALPHTFLKSWLFHCYHPGGVSTGLGLHLWAYNWSWHRPHHN